MAGRSMLDVLLFAAAAQCMAAGFHNVRDSSVSKTLVDVQFPGNENGLNSFHASVVTANPTRTKYDIFAYTQAHKFSDRKLQTGYIVVNPDAGGFTIVNTIKSAPQRSTQSYIHGTKKCHREGASSAICFTRQVSGYSVISSKGHFAGPAKTTTSTTTFAKGTLTITAGAQKIATSNPTQTTSSSPHKPTDDSKTKIGVGVTFGILAVIGALVGAWVIWRRRNRHQQEQAEDEPPPPPPPDVEMTPKFRKEWPDAEIEHGNSSEVTLSGPAELPAELPAESIEELDANNLEELDADAQRLELGTISPKELDSKVVVPRVSLEWPAKRNKPLMEFSEVLIPRIIQP